MKIYRQDEGPPSTYPGIDGIEPDKAVIAWQRIEHYIAYRYSPRAVVWSVQANGCEWIAPLAPVVSLTAQTDEIAAHIPDAGQRGGWMLPEGLVTVSATVGGGPAPEAVLEAVRRYASYIASIDKIPVGVTRVDSGELSLSYRAERIDPARALQNSGAADLLRPYRRIPWA